MEAKLKLVKKIMKLWETNPDEDDYANWEVFKQERFLNGTEEMREEMMIKSVDYNYSYEKEICTLSHYFRDHLLNYFEDKSVLDLGCFTGGRLMRWVEKFGFQKGTGIDINPIFKEAADLYIKKCRPDLNEVTFVTGFGESLPFNDESFDYIISFDVFEHVQNIEIVMEECLRVLKPSGKLFLVFPQFYNPFGSHLGFVTKMPAIHWFFSGGQLTHAYFSIINERGKSADWYSLKSHDLDVWEELPSLNGITVRKFNKIVNHSEFTEILRCRHPIFNDGWKAQEYKLFKIFKIICWIPAQIPILNELFLGKIVSVLQK